MTIGNMHLITDQYLAAYVFRHIKVEDVWVYAKQNFKYGWYGYSAQTQSQAFIDLADRKNFILDDNLIEAIRRGSVKVDPLFMAGAQGDLTKMSTYELLSSEKIDRIRAGVDFGSLVYDNTVAIEKAAKAALQRNVIVRVEAGARDTLRKYCIYDRSTAQLRRGKRGRIFALVPDPMIPNKMIMLPEEFSYSAEAYSTSLAEKAEVVKELEKLFIVS